MSFRQQALAVGLLAVFAALAISSMSRMSVTGDEVAHLPAGYTYVKTADFRLNRQHPPLMKILAGLPLLGVDLKPVAQGDGWEAGREWIFGRDFLGNNRTPMRRIVFLARLPMVLVGLLLGAVLFLWAVELWGYWPGIFVLFLFALSPNFLAHAPLVHTDVGVSSFSVLALYALWKYARSAELRYAAACGVGLGLALLAKYSGVVAVLVVALLLIAMAVARRPGRGPRLVGIAAAGVLIFGLAGLLVSVGFGFPAGLANYAEGFSMIHADANPHWEGFLWGEYSRSGFWHYYLLAQLWKTPLPALLAFAVALLVARWDDRTTLLDWGFILLPIAAFHAAGAWQGASIGVRHVLPAFPFLFLACGAAAHWVGRRRVVFKLAFAGLCAWYAVGTLRVYPHFIPYFNELAGGPDGGIHFLDDSNVEWGQDFYGVRSYLETHRPEQARFLAFEPLGREHYGIEADSIDLRDAVWPRQGVTYLAGASTLQRSSLFNDRPGVRFRWLERYRPVDKIGWSIFVYRFSTDPADAARDDVFYIARQRWYADAERSLNDILSRSPDFDYARQILAEVHHERAGWQAGRGGKEDALVDSLAAVRLAPDESRYRDYFRSLATELAKTVPVDASVPAAQYYEEAFTYGEDQPGRSLLALLKAQRRQPQHVGAHFNLGQLYARLGLIGLAAEEWERTLAIRPGYVPALRSLEHARSLKTRARTSTER